jgi:hypothetical protein
MSARRHEKGSAAVPRSALKHFALQAKMASEVAVMGSDAPPAVPIQSVCLEKSLFAN